jgi:hypothetical protein
MYKICSTCKKEKLFGDFSKNSTRKDGHANQCKICTKDYQCKNKEKISEKKKQYYQANKDNIIEYNKLHKTRIRIIKSQYQKQNKDKVNATAAKRRASKLGATPVWLTTIELQQIEELYEIALAFKLYTGEKYHVDHIIPLQGKNVCGLHVPWNLQVIPAKENISKSNKLIE